MLALDAIFRFGAIGLLFLLLILTLRDQRDNWPGRLLAALSITLAALLFSTAPAIYGLSADAKFIAGLINVPSVILIWLFVQSLLKDNFKMTGLYWLLAALLCVPLWIARFESHGYFDIITGAHLALLNLYALALFVYLMITTVKDRPDDLIEPRRRLRQYFIYASICFTILSIGSAFIVQNDVSFELFVIVPILLVKCLWMLKIPRGHFAFMSEKSPASRASVSELTGRDKQLHAALMLEMTERKAWSEPQITISKLAKRLAVTEHKLRALINQGLGYRNFSTFVNSYRLEAVKTAFENPDTADLPILTLALDAGFNSLPPFNRAFKAAEGQTPKAYRAVLKSS